MSTGTQNDAAGASSHQEINIGATLKAITEFQQMTKAYEGIVQTLQATRANPSDFAAVGAGMAAGEAAKYAELVQHAMTMLSRFVVMEQALQAVVKSYQSSDGTVADQLDQVRLSLPKAEVDARNGLTNAQIQSQNRGA